MSATRITRSRQGCFSCRERKVRCDQRRPRCQTCIKHDRACEYGIRLRWEEDSLAQGLCHGRQKTCSYPSKRSSSTAGKVLPLHGYQFLAPTSDCVHFLNTTSDDIRQGLHGNGRYSDDGDHPRAEVDNLEHPEQQQLTLSQRSHGMNFPPLQLNVITRRRGEHDSSLLSYFEAVICASSTFLDDSSNPYRWVLLPMALQSNGLYHAALAISANTLRLASPDYALLALEHQGAALKHLIRLLAFEDGESKASDEILGLILMLCWFDISDGCRTSWLKHLIGFRGLWSQWTPSTVAGGSHRKRLEQFFTQYFMFHLVLAKTTFHTRETVSTPAQTSRDDDLSGQPLASLSTPATDTSCALSRSRTQSISQSTLFLSKYLPSASLNEIDLYMGFSNSLLLLLDEIAELTNHHGNTLKLPKWAEAAHHLKLRLDKLEQCVPDLGNIQDIESKRLHMAATAETYRIGALLFLHEVVDNVKLIYDGATPIFLPTEKDCYINSILDLVTSNCHAMMDLAVVPLWALFIAGCCADKDTQRIKTMDIFDRLERQHRFGNITPAYRVVQATWKQRDLQQAINPVSDDRRDRRNSIKARKQRNACDREDSPPVRPRREFQYEWEKTLNALGGLRISLT